MERGEYHTKREPDSREGAKLPSENEQEEKALVSQVDAEKSRERLVEGIDKRVNVAMGLRSAIEAIEAEGIHGEEADQRLDRVVEALVDEHFPRIEETKQIEIDINMVDRELDSTYIMLDALVLKREQMAEKGEMVAGTMTVAKLEERIAETKQRKEELESKKKVLSKQLKEIADPIGKEFVFQIFKIKGSLQRKRQQVEIFREERDTEEDGEAQTKGVWAVIKNRFPELPREAFIDADLRTYSADIYVDVDLMNEANRKSGHPVDTVAGLHLNSTPVNLIGAKEGDEAEDYVGVVHHERTHNYFESLFEHVNPWAKIRGVETAPSSARGIPENVEVEFTFDEAGNVAVEESVELYVDDYGTVSMEKEPEYEVSPQSGKVIDVMKDEVLAELELLEGEWYYETDEAREEYGAKSHVERFEYQLGRYSTAGEIAEKYRNALRNIVEDEARPDGERDAARKVEERFIRDFMRMHEGLRKGFELAGRMGDDAREAAHAFVAVMEPSKYRHLSWYLKQRYQGRE